MGNIRGNNFKFKFGPMVQEMSLKQNVNVRATLDKGRSQ